MGVENKQALAGAAKHPSIQRSQFVMCLDAYSAVDRICVGCIFTCMTLEAYLKAHGIKEADFAALIGVDCQLGEICSRIADMGEILIDLFAHRALLLGSCGNLSDMVEHGVVLFYHFKQAVIGFLGTLYRFFGTFYT